MSSEIGESSNNPIEVSTEALVNEITLDIGAAKEKYNGKWIEISGTITYISQGSGMKGYYLYGTKGGDGINITYWVDDSDSVDFSVGDSVVFVGALREVSLINNTEIGLCIVK